jgi:hypothetical protein
MKGKKKKREKKEPIEFLLMPKEARLAFYFQPHSKKE